MKKEWMESTEKLKMAKVEVEELSSYQSLQSATSTEDRDLDQRNSSNAGTPSLRLPDRKYTGLANEGRFYFLFFLSSGFCGILYEFVWLRLAMAQFGVTTALVSIVLSTFMAGLGLGSWAAGILVRRYDDKIKFPPLRMYALIELLIGISALLVPLELRLGHRLLTSTAQQTAESSFTYYLVTGICLALILFPWCVCMGSTIPLGMFAIRRDLPSKASRSFSFLYVANVLGAVVGAILPLFITELYGLRYTLLVGALVNASIAFSAFVLTVTRKRGMQETAPTWRDSRSNIHDTHKPTLVLLFATGLTSMGMEVVWIRLFTPYIGPVVYSFAMVLAIYLLATFLGSQLYRYWSRHHAKESPQAWLALTFLGLLPLLTADARIPLNLVLRVLLGVAPFAGLVGFLTPLLLDRWSAGDPDRAGRAYMLNLLGCIVGPLLAGFLLLPYLGEHTSMLLLAFPWIVVAAWPEPALRRPLLFRKSGWAILGGALVIFVLTKDYETILPRREVLRDSTATVIAAGAGAHRKLLVNGIGMTSLTPVTKMMAHFTLASLSEPPRNALVVCFGMGTTFRSMISWGVSTTAVELVPSVPRLFAYFHEDARQILASPFAHVVIDDGRRYLDSSPQQYDAIVIDPPPPVQAAGSSLLYSQEFYATAKQRLQADGILQQWLPEGDEQVQVSVAKAILNSFPYVRIFRSVENRGWHFLASFRPVPVRSASEMLARMPADAVRDMMEWGPAANAQDQLNFMLSSEMAPSKLVSQSPDTPALQDDRPINEYFLLRTRLSDLMSMEQAAETESINPSPTPGQLDLENSGLRK